VPVGACCRVTGQPVSGPPSNLMIQWLPADAGPGNPRPILTYNSTAQNSNSEFGANWTGQFSRSVSSAGNTATVNTGSGASYAYTNPDLGTGYYDVPQAAQNALKQEASGWTETQPDGLAFRYDANGQLQYLKNSAGSRWTLTHDVGGKVTRLTSPGGARTTLVYDTGLPSRIRRLQDAGGRITSFTVNGAGQLVRITGPDLCVTSMAYSSGLLSALLTAWVTPSGQRTTVTWHNTNQVQAVIAPTGQRTTYTSSGVIFPNGQRTTLSYLLPGMNNLRTIVDPVGRLMTFTYLGFGGDRLAGIFDGPGAG
jgi:YD repeat-containing protein